MSMLPKAHHVRRELCTTRAPYRSGRQLKAVKVYTVSQESRYLLVQGIPALGVYEDLIKEFALYGAVEEYRLLDEYPAEEFTEVMWIKFVKIQSARLAKRKLDNYEFCGGKLHVCYAPEYETVEDTRAKLEDRRRAVARRVRQLAGKGRTEAVSGGESCNKSELSETSNALSVESSSVDVPKSLPSSVPQPLPPPPPPPLIHPVQSTVVQYFPPLPPPPVEHVRLPPHHIHPDTRWRLPSTTPHTVTVFPPSVLHPPPTLPQTSQSLNPSHHLVQGLVRTVHHLGGPRAGKESHLSTASEIIVSCESVTTSCSSSMSVVKDFKYKGPTPRFFPRQLGAVRTVASSASVPKIRDPVTEELKQNAFILSSTVQGPALPSEIDQKRKEFKDSETGSGSLDKTVHAIRQKVSRLSDVSPPVKKAKLKEV